MALLYRTKDRSSPYGKPKVFFTCHPEDWDTYFLPVCEDLFQFCNCAVYYNDPKGPGSRDEDHRIHLLRMNLLVIPVTAAFLTQSNPALEYDFRFALEHHIPILPLVQEPGLDKLFAKKCGNLQYLDKTLHSPTAIPYEEKLEQFLRSVLLNDETVSRIRAHFDGHAFLSYRKKDRRYIHELMKLIHSFPQFRDIGLWYDEYLTPGEDFNDEIEAHLNASRLFALIVTPNLVNEKNYVQEHEYPQAVERNKPVVPILYEPTDSDALRRDYPDIPDCLDPEDVAAVEDILNGVLSGIACRGNDSDPEHWYHIGLAYLTGTDVEVNHDLAVKLITAAADAGLEEAMEKLVYMYHFGQSVAPDETKALLWTQKLIALSKRKYQKSKDFDTAKLYLKRLASAALMFNADWGQNHALAFANDLLTLSKELCGDGNFPSGVLAAAYETSARVYDVQGLDNKAADCLLAAFQIRCSLYKNAQDTSPRRLQKLIHICHQLADIYKGLQNLSGAERYYTLAIQYIDNLSKNTEVPPYRPKLAALHQDLGEVYVLREDFDRAEKEYLAALEIAKAIAAESRDDRILISHYHSLAELEDRRSPMGSGRKYLKEALKIAQKRDINRSTDQTQKDLASCHLKLGVSYYSAPAIRIRGVIRAKALPHLEKALAIYRALDQKHNRVGTKSSIQTALAALTELHFSLNLFREAESYCLDSLTISQEIDKVLNTPTSKLSVAYDCSALSKVYEALKQPEKADLYAWRRFKLLDQMAEEVNTREIWNELAEASFDLAVLIQSAQKMNYAMVIWQQLARIYPDEPYYAEQAQKAREYLPES